MKKPAPKAPPPDLELARRLDAMNRSAELMVEAARSLAQSTDAQSRTAKATSDSLDKFAEALVKQFLDVAGSVRRIEAMTADSASRKRAKRDKKAAKAKPKGST
jgi:hypothetical protein